MSESAAVSEEQYPRDVPTWKWLAGGTLAVVGFLTSMWMRAVAEDLDTLAKTVTESLATHGERLASLEAKERAATMHLDRIEVKLDRVIERIK